jgi:VacB/RNase II family 3'-5' exoribonuclease
MTADRKIDLLKAVARRAMLARGLEPDFSDAALHEAGALKTPAASTESAIRDLRGLLWCSIDNDDSRDLDQLTVAAPLADGAARILVAVADVDALVRRGSAIDEHARTNTTSVYTVPQVFPMLPLNLSTDLTSLGEGQDRLAIVIDMAVGMDGAVGASEIYRSWVRNRAKLTYDAVAAWLDGKAAPPAGVAAVPGLDALLELQDRAAHALRRVRQARGALALESLEARAVFDAGALSDLAPERKNRAQELIEDFMIAANGVTAQFLESRRAPSIRRILRTPKKWGRIVELAAQSGYRLPAEPSVLSLSAFLTERRGADPSRFVDLSLAVLKLLGRGEYALHVPGQPIEGHFGLAVSDYTHSTAPNRRFPDLLTQRMLKSALGGPGSGYSQDELRSLAAHCTAQEDNAAKVERQVAKSAAALLLAAHIGERYQGIVTGAADKGTWVRISHPTAEGRLVKGFQGLDVGDAVQIRLLRSDVERGFIDFERVA